jgi:hypothetical protein
MLEPRELLAATYYVSATGNDNADGRSAQTAWRTIARVNGKNWNPGDRVLFQGGKTFTVSGTAGPELLTNAGFESGLSNWSDTMGTRAAGAAPTSVAHGGVNSIRLSGSGDVVRAQEVTAQLKGNQAYKMSVWTKTASPGSGDRRVGITFYLNGQAIATHYKGFRSTSWAQTQWEFVSPGSFDKAVVWVSRKGDASTFYADDVSLKSIPNGIQLDSTDAGTAQSPVIIGSYGAGRATIDARDGIGLWAFNVGGLSVQNLIFTGSWDAYKGSGANAGVGIDFVNTLASNTKLSFIRVDNVETKKFRWAGIRVGGWNGKSGFRDVRITNSIAHENGDAGILIRGEFSRTSTAYANENVYIAGVKAYENNGIPNKGGNSGSGIQLTDTLGGTIERCVAHHNGDLNNYTEGGPVGIWAFDASKTTIWYNESYANKTGSGKDGAGFDLDGGVTNSTLEYNYSHDNDGPGFLLCQFTGARTWGKNSVRYNISQNDARRNVYGAVTFTGGTGLANAILEQNTLYVSASKTGGTASGVRITSSGPGIKVRNNIIQTAGGAPVVDAASSSNSVAFNGNDYWSSGSSLRIRWGSSQYSSLPNWRSSTGREKSGSALTGLSVDPRLSAAGKGGTLGDAWKLSSLSAYRLRSDSPLINASVSLASSWTGYTSLPTDFFGKTFTTRRDIGASEYA